MVPGGGLMFKGYDLNHSYEDCDVFVSLAKLKEHFTAGRDPFHEELLRHTPARFMATGRPWMSRALFPWAAAARSTRKPPALQERPPPADPTGSKDRRLPRAARGGGPGGGPARASAIIDGIQTMAGGEGPWVNAQSPRQSRLADCGNQLRQH